MELNIEQILESEKAWEYILLEIVKSEELDPWNIDITQLTHKYLEKISRMKELDLRVPARIILAAAVLLKMKSDQLLLYDNKEIEAAFDEMFHDETVEVPGDNIHEIPLLDLRVRRKPLRKITLEDLLVTLRRSMHPKKKREKAVPIKIEFPEVDMTEQIDELYKRIIASSLNRIAFSELLKEKTIDEVVEIFMPLLHLANDHKVNLEQKEFFKEFYVLKKAG